MSQAADSLDCDHDLPPKIDARFFYTSLLPIDDPLSAVPLASSSQTASGLTPQPFSTYDNTALEETWHALKYKLEKYRREQEKKAVSQPRKRGLSPFSKKAPSKPERNKDAATAKSQATTNGHTTHKPAIAHTSIDVPASQPVLEAGSLPSTTGTPFIRAPSRSKVNLTLPERTARPKFAARDTYLWDDDSHLVEHSPPRTDDEEDTWVPEAKIPVGVSRLHQVEMPNLEMTPIYWLPINDEAPVIRGTWFYQDTMLPVEPDVANMLEAGYVDLRVWTDTWKDELRSAVAIGSSGEEKIVHRLWPDDPLVFGALEKSNSSAVTATSVKGAVQPQAAVINLVSDEPETLEQAHHRIEVAAREAINAATAKTDYDNTSSAHPSYRRKGGLRSYSSYGVIYASNKEARLLKPSLLPSEYYGRRPLANYILRGRKLGIAVVRGFDSNVWKKLHPEREDSETIKAESGVASAASGVSPKVRHKSDPTLAKSSRPVVTDLVLVIHGIGQKLSRRMESWHFTHAMNGFRREVNVEMGNKDVNKLFRGDMGGVMVLPVNWRQSMSIADDELEDAKHKQQSEGFTLEDITPDTLASVRNIVSDVMLDIPYYMSHHQPKMIAAVIDEANRVYKLWCQNNPGFAKTGRVHIIAHSLGSVMSLDILSRQPTHVEPAADSPEESTGDAEHFLFNTSNLFLAGSPAGFFLLLRKAQLRPRLDSNSAMAESDPLSKTDDVCGRQGEYGCIAVENIYNIVNGYDPVAYRINAAVDAAYAGSLKKATIPSAVSSWFGRGDNSSWFGGSVNGAADSQKPTLPRLPSNVELEPHNFTREQIAEKRMFLLNDNGQIDYHIRYGGGPLEIQYLTMLSAHSSYWLLRDFTRMIVLEIGRPFGKEGTLVNMRAVKKRAHLT